MRPRRLNPAIEARFKRWTLRKPRFAVMGEFSAGKSTLLNFILGHDFLPTQVTATHLPAIWMRKGPNTAQSEVMSRTRNWKTIATPKLESTALLGQALLRMQVNTPGLSQFDIIDTPGISDPDMPFDTLAAVAGYCDFILWCTHATQAWRQSEAAAYAALPARLRKNSLLIVTRADKLGSAIDRQKVKQRLVTQTKGLFRAVVLLSTPIAAQAHRNPKMPNQARIWADSGGAEFVAEMTKSLVYVKQRREAILMRKTASMLPSLPEKTTTGFFFLRRFGRG